MTVALDGSSLCVDEVVRVARGGERVELAPGVTERMRAARALVERVLARGDEVYGLTTGVGMRKRIRVSVEEQAEFNRMLILNHRVAQGAPVADDVVRAAILRLTNALATGTPGVRPELAERLAAALNGGERPVVRSLGSIGQADLAQGADLAHALFAGVPLEAKEGLALLNSNCFSTGAAALAVADAGRLADAMDVAGALDLEAFAANLTILHERVGEVRPYPGLVATLARLRLLLEGSYLWSAEAARNLQDPLTFRNVAQVHASLRDALTYVDGVIAIELNAAQENPLPVPGEGRIVSVGNYEILPLATALDFLRIALAPALSSAAERAVKLLQAPLTGLPEGLAPRSGLPENSVSEFGVPVQALAAEARLLAAPVSYELVSTTHAEGIEDRMTMAPLAARRTAEMIALGERVVAIELVLSCQAVDLRRASRAAEHESGKVAPGVLLGAGTRQAYERVRERVPFMDEGDPVPQNLEPVVELVRSGAVA
jgi:histidine ammonia-lyase